jgi:hypothetical protein
VPLTLKACSPQSISIQKSTPILTVLVHSKVAQAGFLGATWHSPALRSSDGVPARASPGSDEAERLGDPVAALLVDRMA